MSTHKPCPACREWNHPENTCCPKCDHVFPGKAPDAPLGEHYRRGGIEAWDVIEAWGLGFNMGNVLKYTARCGVKTPDKLEDLEKIKSYIEREIKEVRRERDK